MTDLLTVDSQVEYALYALAVAQPALFADAERFVGGMLANDQDAARRVKALLEQLRAEAERVTWEMHQRALRAEAALRALYEEVEMAESVGICLSDRVPALRARGLLADLPERGQRGGPPQ